MFLGFWNACKQKFIFRGGGGILGCLGRPTPPPGGRAGSENDTLLPMTMICDRLKFWSGPAWRSKVIIRKPWRRKNKKKKKKKKKEKKKKKKFWQTHKAFPAGSRECLIMLMTSTWAKATALYECSAKTTVLEQTSRFDGCGNVDHVCRLLLDIPCYWSI